MPIVWDDKEPDWSQFDACLIRSTSDYHEKYDQFLRWVARVGGSIPIWNSPEMTTWNADKAYLRDLSVKGIPTIPTLWLDQGSTADLDEILETRGWPIAVIKPSIGLGSQHLEKVHRGGPGCQQALDCLLQEHRVLVQPFLSSIEEMGEASLIYIHGKLAHAVKKWPANGDFRVQRNWGGTSELHKPTRAELDIGSAALACLDEAPLFGRVDIVTDQSLNPCLIEMELIEPDLFLRHTPATADLFADAIAIRLMSR